MFSTLTPEVARLGIRSTYLGEEAAHGVEAKHDRSVNWGAPKPTTTSTAVWYESDLGY